MQFIINLQSFRVEADTETKAKEKAETMLFTGKEFQPEIESVEQEEK